MTNKVTISTKKQLRSIKNELTKKTTVNIIKIVVSKKVSWEVTATPRNLLKVGVKEAFVLNGKTEVVVDNFTDTIVSVQFLNGSDDQKKAVLDKSVLFHSVAIKLDGRKSDVISIAKSPKGLVGYSFMTNKRTLINLDELKHQGYSLYVAGPYSASEARKNSTTLYKTNSSKEFVSKLNELTYGAYEVLEGSDITLEESQKIAARMGQWKTGMSHTEECDLTVAFFAGKWEIDGTQYGDGKAYLRDVKVAQVLSNEKYEIDRNAVEGLLIQCRPFSVCKTEAKTTNGNYIKEKILFDAGHNVIWINREEVTKEIQEAFNKIFIKGETSTFRGKVIIIKPKDAPEDLRVVDYYTDLNGLKASYDLRLDSGLNILAIDKPLKGGVANTNMQQLETFVMADPEATKQLMKEIAFVHNKKLYYGALTPAVKVPTIKEVEQMYTIGLVKSIAPKFALQNKKVFGAIADQATKAMVKTVNGLNYKIPGQSRILQMDFGAEFGVRILEPGTCFAPGIKEKWIFGTRNPKQYSGEFLLLKNLTREEVMNRIKELIKVKELAKLLMREYRLLSDSTVVVPAIEEIKDAIGGADVDGDTLTLVFHRKLTAVIKKAVKENKVKSTAIEVSNSSQKQDKDRKFGLKAIHSAFVELITNGNLSIGEVTLMNNFMLGCLFDLLNGNSAAALEFFKFAGNEGYGVDYYDPLNREELEKIDMNKIHVSFEEMKRVVQNIKTMKLTKENMIAALDDLNAIFMMLQMETIDAAKKGTTVPVPFKNLLNKFKQTSKTKLDVCLGIKSDSKKDYKGYKEIDGVKYLVETRKGWQDIEVGQQVNKVYFHQDLLHEIRLEAARDVMRAARRLRKMYDKVSFSDDTKHLFLTKLDATDIRLVRDLRELKNLYNSINAGVSEDEAQEPYYAVYLEALANTVRLITKDMPDAERAVLVEAVCMPSEDGRSRYSSFAMNTLKEEYIKMAVEHFAEIDVAGEPLMVRKNVEEGDILNFNLGVAKDGDKLAATRADISGEFVIRKINDRYYATKNIVDLIPKVEMNNKIIFRAVDEDIDTLKDTLMNAQNVELKVEFKKGNLIIADGKVVGKFITSSGFGPLNRLYQDNKGTVEKVMVVQERMNNGDMKDVLIAVLDCNETPVVDYTKPNNDGELQVDLEATQEVSDDDLF